MAISGLSPSRVSNLLRTSVATQNITNTQRLLLQVQNELSTGKRVNTPSDDPTAAATIQQLNKTMERRQSYATNLGNAASQLGEVDNKLTDMTGLLQQAKQLASKDVGSDATPDMRAADAEIVSSLYSQMLSIGNTQFNGVYLFGGDGASSSPFVEGGNGVQFIGTQNSLKNVYDENIVQPFMVNGADVFGANVGVVGGSTDLSPAVSAATRLSDLGGAVNKGVTRGSIQVSDGTTTGVVDLSSAETLGDVKQAIEKAVPGMTVGFSGGSLTLTSSVPGANVTVNEVAGGNTALSFGLLSPTGAGTGSPLVGASVKPRITPQTPVTDLANQLPIDLSGLKITNGSSSATITLAPTDTVESLLSKINSAGLGVQAAITDSGTGISITNTTQGAALSIGENGGSTATQLGIRTYSPATRLSSLNGGKGLKGNASGDIRVTDANGSVYVVSLESAQTVQDAINAINTATGGAVNASFATSGNGIILKDTTGGAGTMKLEPLNYSTAIADLGLNTNVSGNTITGTDATQVTGSGIFGNLQALRKAMLAGDQNAISAAADALDKDWSRVSRIQGQMGARVQEIKSRQSRLEDENVSTTAMLSQLQDVDFTEAITRYQSLQTSLQATLQANGKTLDLSLLDFLK